MPQKHKSFDKLVNRRGPQAGRPRFDLVEDSYRGVASNDLLDVHQIHVVSFQSSLELSFVKEFSS